MIYLSHTKRELMQSGIQEGELAIYTGTVSPRQADSLSPDTNPQNAYIYFWKNNQPQELDAEFQHDKAGIDVLEAQTETGEYTFLRDKPSGHIRQLSGPAKPIIAANLGAIPLRVDTFLGKFAVCAGTMLRLDEFAPQREKKKIRLTVTSRHGQPLESAELWDGVDWQRLNICEGPSSFDERLRLTIRDGSAIVQHMEVNSKREILMPDSPEPDPDYEIFVCGHVTDEVTLRFDRSDYRDGQVVRRARTIHFSCWGEPIVYDLQKLRESPSQRAVRQCITELPGREAVPVLEERQDLLYSDKPREFLDGGDEPGRTALETGEIESESRRKALSVPEELAQSILRPPGSTPESPGDFPE